MHEFEKKQGTCSLKEKGNKKKEVLGRSLTFFSHRGKSVTYR
jgi:hypothetical protein